MSDTTKTIEPSVGQWAIWPSTYQRTGCIGEILKVTPKLLYIGTDYRRSGMRQISRGEAIAIVASEQEAKGRVAAAECSFEAHSEAVKIARLELTQAEHRQRADLLAALRGEAA